jgi:uncharacterized protein
MCCLCPEKLWTRYRRFWTRNSTNHHLGGAGTLFTPYRSLTRMLMVAGEVRGRKKLQKMVFIAGRLGYPFPEPYDLHVWGPYSDVLAVKLQEMTDWGFAREEELPGPAGNTHYVYRAGANAARALEGTEEMPELQRNLSDLVAHLNGQDSTFLEGVATVMYLRAKGMADSEVCDMLPRLKPDKFSDTARVEACLTFATNLESFRMTDR